MTKLAAKFFLICTFTMLALFSACDSNRLVDDLPDGNISVPDDTAIANVGPSQQLVTEHVLVKANSIRSSLSTIINNEFGGGTGMDPNNFLLYAAGPDDNTDPQTADVDVSENISCDDGGSRNIIGSLTFEHDNINFSGSFSGTFTIAYDNCEDIALMEALDSNCAVTPAINGEIAVTISGSYNLGSTFSDNQTTNDTTTLSATTTVDLDITTDNTNSQQGYFFEYALTSDSSNTNLDGNVSFNNLLYDIVDVQDSIGISPASVVCP